jgi:hypothetical protein
METIKISRKKSPDVGRRMDKALIVTAIRVWKGMKGSTSMDEVEGRLEQTRSRTSS